MGRVVSIGLFAGLLALALVGHCAEEFVFPVGLWVLDMPGYQTALTDERVVDLRSRGIEMVVMDGFYTWTQKLASGDSVQLDVDSLKRKLAWADSFGFKVYAVPQFFNGCLRLYGRNTERNPPFSYFRGDNPLPDDDWFMRSEFEDSLGKWVSWVVDTLRVFLDTNDIQSLYRYMYWDEPCAKHLLAIKTDTIWDDYWWNFWKHEDTSGWHTDSLGVGSLLKREVEQKDTLHSVWINLTGDHFRHNRVLLTRCLTV
jgi:hypothetical protein